MRGKKFRCEVCGKPYDRIFLSDVVATVDARGGAFYWKCVYCGHKNEFKPEEYYYVIEPPSEEKLIKAID
jgi:transcription elongation factor Elf1